MSQLDDSPSSLELVATSRIIARECASLMIAYKLNTIESINKNEANNKENILLGQQVIDCSHEIIKNAKDKTNKEFVDFQKCLDKSGYRFQSCKYQFDSFHREYAKNFNN